MIPGCGTIETDPPTKNPYAGSNRSAIVSSGQVSGARIIVINLTMIIIRFMINNLPEFILSGAKDLPYAVSNMNDWIVVLCEREELKGDTRSGIWKPMLGHAENGCGI